MSTFPILKRFEGINVTKNDIEIGDILKMSAGKGDSFTFILVVDVYNIDTISINKEDNNEKFNDPDYLVKYWAEHNQKIIQKPTFLIKGVHILNGGMLYTYPNTVIIEHFINPLTRTIIRRFKNDLY